MFPGWGSSLDGYRTMASCVSHLQTPWPCLELLRTQGVPQWAVEG